MGIIADIARDKFILALPLLLLLCNALEFMTPVQGKLRDGGGRLGPLCLESEPWRLKAIECKSRWLKHLKVNCDG